MTIRWFWRLYGAFVSLLLVGGVAYLSGPPLELAISPVLTAQTISEVRRESGKVVFGDDARDVTRICWRWNRVKRRPLAFYAPNIDVFIDAPGDTAVGEIYNRKTGARWAKSAAVSAGPVDQTWCADVPPNMVSAGPLRIRQTAFYPGLFNAWTLPVQVPDVVEPAGAKVP